MSSSQRAEKREERRCQRRLETSVRDSPHLGGLRGHHTNLPSLSLRNCQGRNLQASSEWRTGPRWRPS